MADWIDASQKPERPVGSWCSPFVLLAVTPECGIPYHMLGYWHFGTEVWRNNYGPIETGGYGLIVTHWMPLPPIPGG